MFTERPSFVNDRELNVVVRNQFFVGDEDIVFFDGEPVWLAHENVDMFDLLLALGVFPSKSQARKNWKGPSTIPDGFSRFEKIGHLRKSLFILKPTSGNMVQEND